jgi:hypothetical protein
MPTYKVTIIKETLACRSVLVNAKDEGGAFNIALEEAGDHEYFTYASSYIISDIEEKQQHE